jgi:hypothetical protein
MPLYFRTGIGPIRYSTRIAGGKRRKRKTASSSSPNLVMIFFWMLVAAIWLIWAAVALPVAGLLSIAPATRPAGRKMAGSVVWWGGKERRAEAERQAAAAREQQLLAEYQQAEAQADAQRQAELEKELAGMKVIEEARAARTYRATITECHIDPLHGGQFTVTSPDDSHPNLQLNVTPDMALPFASLRKGDIVQVTLAPGNSGIQEFWHLARASGAKPRNPADFPDGFTTGAQ